MQCSVDWEVIFVSCSRVVLVVDVQLGDVWCPVVGDGYVVVRVFSQLAFVLLSECMGRFVFRRCVDAR
eukprot:7067812-Pyramimonas_sp.AAC.1